MLRWSYLKHDTVLPPYPLVTDPLHPYFLSPILKNEKSVISYSIKFHIHIKVIARNCI